MAQSASDFNGSASALEPTYDFMQSDREPSDIEDLSSRQRAGDISLGQWPLARGISWGLAVATIVVLSWALYELRFGFEPSVHLDRSRRLFVACLGIQTLLGGVLVFRIVGVWRTQQKALAQSRLFRRLIGFSVFIAGAPTFVIAVTAMLVMTLGLQGWFGPRVGEVVDRSLSTADAFLDEHLETQRANALRMGLVVADLSFTGTAADLSLSSRQMLIAFLSTSAREIGIDAVVVFDQDFVIYGEGGLQVQTDLQDIVSRSTLETLREESSLENAIAVLTSRDDTTFTTVMPHAKSDDLYVLTVNAISDSILDRTATTAEAAGNFKVLSGNVLGYQQLFVMLFLSLALALALFAAWGGLRLAVELARPILRVTTAAERLAKGEWLARVPSNQGPDANELDTLAQTFNRMAADLGQQQSALQDANASLAERQRFTEAVLAGVSAGVIGLDAKGNIDLPNETASFLLDKDLSDWVGLPLADVVPGFMPLLEHAHHDPQGVFTEEITITRRNGAPRQLLTNAVAEAPNGIIEGYVFTFDDVTDFQLAQRRAAWSDVARRIAHEIKNPLTPIQLSAERLKRRYQKEVSNNPELFGDLVDTIIRQVGEIGRMVDEFSGFARMPEPRMAEHDLRDIVRQAVFLQSNAFEGVQVTMTLPSDPVVLTVDEQLLSQAIINLVKNAAESLHSALADHTLANGSVEVSVLIQPDDMDASIHGARIEVRDNGEGYPTDMMPKLMEPYVTTREKGTGLGLAIVRKVMEDHGGELRLLNGHAQENLCGARAILLFNS